MPDDISMERLQEHTVAMVSAMHDTPLDQADAHPDVPRPLDAPAFKVSCWPQPPSPLCPVPTPFVIFLPRFLYSFREYAGQSAL
jgi:hypothetical protein